MNVFLYLASFLKSLHIQRTSQCICPLFMKSELYFFLLEKYLSSLLSCFSSQFFQPLLSHPLVFIYRLSLVGLSWWEGSFPRWWVPLSHIPDHMGAIICDRYDFLGTCTKHQLVLSWRIPKALFLDLGIIGDAWSGCKLGPSPFRGRARCSVSK